MGEDTSEMSNVNHSMYAVIDIGSNSIRYMEQGGGDKKVITTRLGSGLASSGRLSQKSMARSVSVIAALAANARHAGYYPVAYATSAVRDASNRDEFLAAVYAASGVMPDVLSGEREAEYAYRAAAPHGGGLIDVGGASTQIMSEGFGISYPIGCVRGKDIALARTGSADCDDNWSFQREALTEYIRSIVRVPKLILAKCAGVGGSITTLAALKLGLDKFDSTRVDGSVLTRDDVENLIGHLHDLGPARRGNPLLVERHDVILYGAAILAFAMDSVCAAEITVSTKDGMEGYFDFIIHERGEN